MINTILRIKKKNIDTYMTYGVKGRKKGGGGGIMFSGGIFGPYLS